MKKLSLLLILINISILGIGYYILENQEKRLIKIEDKKYIRIDIDQAIKYNKKNEYIKSNIKKEGVLLEDFQIYFEDLNYI
jgi:hypothetical protein